MNPYPAGVSMKDAVRTFLFGQLLPAFLAAAFWLTSRDVPRAEVIRTLMAFELALAIFSVTFAVPLLRTKRGSFFAEFARLFLLCQIALVTFGTFLWVAYPNYFSPDEAVERLELFEGAVLALSIISPAIDRWRRKA